MLDDEGRAMTQAGEPIEDNTIVEFNFDLVDKIWKAMRVRTDKTETTSATRRWSTGYGERLGYRSGRVA
jgi:hypothetical protein